MITILPHGGLGNRLRVIFSYYNYAISNNETLTVIWLQDVDIAYESFLNLFEPVEHITFLSNNKDKLPIHYEGVFCCKHYPPIYDKLQIKPYLQDIINERINIIGDYIAVHVRRGDHIRVSKNRNAHTEWSDFIKFINKEKKDKNLYIATDNKITYTNISNKYKKIVKFSFPKENPRQQKRRTKLIDSVVDIYMCVNASEFLGSGWSSFSELIEQLRNPNPNSWKYHPPISYRDEEF